MSADALATAIRLLAAGESLDEATTAGAFDVVMRGDASAAQMAAVLMALRVKGETAEEVAGGARALRRAMVRLPAPNPEQLVDTCGTGGGRVPTFNISTAAALLAAGMGVRIAKHGNRSFTSRCGSADVLEALGIAVEVPVEKMTAILDRAGIVFMYAPLMHPAMRHVGPVRRELAIPTMMNVLGPLANPAGAGRQVVGVADRPRLLLMAQALARLGCVHAMVVHGEPGMDEISPLATTRVMEVRGSAVTEWEVEPQRFGAPPATPDDLAGGSPAENAALIEAVLGGGGPPGARSAVVLNAAAAVYVAGHVATYAEGVPAVARALASGCGLAALRRLRESAAPGV